jgi:DNA-binding transcriptional ArsR family regulator
MPAVETINPRAYLTRIRNVRRGVVSRSRIIDSIASGSLTTQEICKKSGLSPPTVRYHLKNMYVEGLVVRRRIKGGIRWSLTGSGQKTIEESL